MTSTLSARSVIVSTLLGTFPPRLPGRLLVAFAGEFDINPGTTRVALSRMVDRGELVRTDGGVYELTGRLLERQRRQEAGLDPLVREWTGDWEMSVVAAGRRGSADRAALRAACAHLGLAEVREGVRMRPDNLDPGRLPEARRVVDAQTSGFMVRPHDDPALLARSLFAVDDWASTADRLRSEMAVMTQRLVAPAPAPLAEGFELAAAALRHLVGDPLLPEPIWPWDWPAPALREGYRHYDVAYRAELAAFFRSRRDTN